MNEYFWETKEDTAIEIIELAEVQQDTAIEIIELAEVQQDTAIGITDLYWGNRFYDAIVF